MSLSSHTHAAPGDNGTTPGLAPPSPGTTVLVSSVPGGMNIGLIVDESLSRLPSSPVRRVKGLVRTNHPAARERNSPKGTNGAANPGE